MGNAILFLTVKVWHWLTAISVATVFIAIIGLFLLNIYRVQSSYKNIVVFSHAQQIVFIVLIFINYIIISISLIWLHRTLKRQKT